MTVTIIISSEVRSATQGRGWVMAKAKALTAAALIKALEAGDFYSPTGVEFSELRMERNTIAVKIKAESGIGYHVHFIGADQNDKPAHELKVVPGTEGSFTLSSDHPYVRTKITSSKLKPNPFHQGEYEAAWTQPVRHVN